MPPFSLVHLTDTAWVIWRTMAGALAITCLLVTVVSAKFFIDATDSAEQMRMIDIASRNLLISLLDAETGQRGYVITGDERFLEPYFAGREMVPGRLAELQSFGADTEQAARITDVGRINGQKLKELEMVVELRKKSFADAQSEVQTHLGKNLMDQIRQHLDEIELWAMKEHMRAEDQAILFGRISFLAMLITLVTGFLVAFTERSESPRQAVETD